MLGRTLFVEGDDARQARELAERYPGLSPRDLIHLAIAQHHGISDIITADTGFDAVSEVRRLDPSGFPFH